MPLPLALIILILLSALVPSCVPKRAEIPTYEGRDIRDELASKEEIRSITSHFVIEGEKSGQMMRGDAVLRLTPETLDLQVFSLGFLIAEVTANNGVMRSNPPMDRGRLLMFVDGLRSCFFWWTVKEPDILETALSYRVSNSWRRLFVNKRTLMPEKQIIELEDGKELTIFYDDPELLDGTWFPSRMRIELSPYAVQLSIKEISFNTL